MICSIIRRHRHKCGFKYVSNLVSQHSPFLMAVKHHGEGSVEVMMKDYQTAQIEIHNPTRKNAMSGKMLYELAYAVDFLLNECMSNVNCVVLRSKGDSAVFCSGLDLNLAKDIINTPEMGVQMSQMMTSTLNSIRNSPFISVALLEGPAIGGGAELSTCCDFRFMSSSSYCQFVHGKLGVSPGWGGLNRLVSIVGRTNALKLLGTSMRLTPDQAKLWGYADCIYSPEEDANKSLQDFLEPYSKHRFPEALKNLKHAVVESVAVSESGNTRGKLEEIFAFQRRWGGADNKKAISGNNKP